MKMAPTKVDQGTIFILDIGKNVSQPDEKDSKSFFEKAKECTARIIERKIISQAKSLVGIILLGSKKTNNSLAEQCPSAFRNIEIYTELQYPTWQMIRDLPDSPTNKKGDWFEALIVAYNYFKNDYTDSNIKSKKIILMTNFKNPAHLKDDDVEQPLIEFKEDKLEVDVIGPDLYGKKCKDMSRAFQFVQISGGATATFEYTMRYLLFHKRKAINAMPWNVDLSIGPKIKIPVSSYLKTKDEPIIKNWMKAVKDPVTGTASSTEGLLKNRIHINTENQNVVNESDTIKGYHYGQQIIPFSECDKFMLYESGEKSLSIYGFTPAKNINWQNLNGDGLSYIIGRKGNKKAQLALTCLVECMHELNLVGIARRVYNKGNAPKMFALMPVIDTNDFVGLSMAAICYKEDIKNMAFPPTNLKKYACTDEQVNAFKDLIQAMDLTKAYDENFDDMEAFPIAETVSPIAQYVMDCIAFRSMNPDKPLPQPRDDIMMLFKIPPKIEKASREPLEKLKKMFTLNKVEPKPKRKQPILEDTLSMKQDPIDQVNELANVDYKLDFQLPIIKKNEIVRIGTIDPIDDFKTLIQNDKTLADLSAEMTKVIENLAYCNLDGKYSKALNTMKFFRTECVNSEPSYYNNWLLTFKTALRTRKKNDLIDLIDEMKLSFILKVENNLSTFDAENSHEDSQLYENNTIPNTTELIISASVNDMFDEM